MRIAVLLHQFHRLAVELFHDGDMRHGTVRRSPVQVLLTGRDSDHVPPINFLYRITPTLHTACARRHDQDLAQRVGMARGASAGRAVEQWPETVDRRERSK